ncbi:MULTISPECIES: efflux transporter outer membrane subunit [Rhizobium]|uniref:Nodulation protein NodT n=1 Tax=Rhizobium wuzhouense TaxID=1986026 RepID=A0ABX5NLY4_9HYPH|nr:MULTISPECIES: efflux transporter outer membrane subunit [Rhizobium]PYB70482.1 nodulation protein NodT [Rhizobium wuzhouense]RKE77619.1 multidrug efflux system outer membrane protein [Rhizobium sp. AG855]
MPSIRAAAPLVMLLLSGCVVGPNHETPQTALPVKFSEGSARAAGDVSLASWWTAFNDPRLNKLVEKGLAQNLDVLQAIERITAAEANFEAAGAAAIPQLTVSGQHQVSGSSGTGDFNGTGSGGQDSPTRNTTTGSANVSWLLDLFGQYRRAKEGAKASLDGAYARADVAKLTFLSSVVTAYVDARYYQERIAIARKNLASRKETLELTRLQLEAGAASRLDVVQSEGLVNSTVAEIPSLEIGFRQSVHRISLLLGLPATTLLADLQKGAAQPYARRGVNAGVPADLIRNRPDIRAAERSLAAATAEVGVAEAALYPSITLSGSISPSYIVTSAANGGVTSWGFGPSLNLPIFDGGQRRANVKARESAAREAYLAWKQTVLSAVAEVENALVAVNRTRQTVSALTATVRSYEEALSLATASYRDGASSLLDVLDAQRNVASAQANLAQAVQQLASNYVALNVAIGGGYAWDSKTVVASK